MTRVTPPLHHSRHVTRITSRASRASRTSRDVTCSVQSVRSSLSESKMDDETYSTTREEFVRSAHHATVTHEA